MSKGQIRLDRLLVEQGHYPTRSKARGAIMAGLVYVDGRRVDKAGAPCSPQAVIEIRGPSNPFVSRGGLKLDWALDQFKLDVRGKTCVDVGASTGGFTDCLLQRGARRVFAVDVGYGQLDWKLRQDSRVVVMERTNFRHVQAGDLPEMDMAVMDVSFISLQKILPAVGRVLRPHGDVVALVKPQFEAGREAVGKGGVVRDADTHFRVLKTLIAFGQNEGWQVLGLTHSPVRGAEGNIEFFLWWRLIKGSEGGEQEGGHPDYQGLTVEMDDETLRSAVAFAHRELVQ